MSLDRHRWRASAMPLGYCALWLILLLATVAMLAVGGRPDPAGLGVALDGPWRFHPGDDPAWADPATDDRGWDRFTLVSDPAVRDGDVGIPGYLDGWRARGHPQLEGYGWYRRQVALPPRGDLVLLGPPLVDDAYAVFWNGHRVGGGLAAPPRITATRPTLLRLPPANGAATATLAIRTFLQPGFDRDGVSGGLRTAPVLAARADGERLYRGQWRRTIAGYVVDAVEPAAMLLLAALAVFGAPARTRPAFARWMAVALVASAGLRLGNAIVAWTDLLDVQTLLWHNDVVLAPLAKLGWAMAWNQWTDGRDRRWVSIAAVMAWIAMVVAALAHLPSLAGAGRGLFALLLAVIALRIARHGTNRILVLAAMALVATGLFAGDLSALGFPGIWFPFNIGVSRSQYAYALALPLLVFVLAAPVGRRSGQG